MDLALAVVTIVILSGRANCPICSVINQHVLLFASKLGKYVFRVFNLGVVFNPSAITKEEEYRSINGFRD